MDSGSAIDVRDVSGARRAVGKRVTVTGTARDAKLAAAVILADGTPVYCLGTELWPEPMLGKPIVATGTLDHTKDFVAEPWATGPQDAVWVLHQCKLATP